MPAAAGGVNEDGCAPDGIAGGVIGRGGKANGVIGPLGVADGGAAESGGSGAAGGA